MKKVLYNKGGHVAHISIKIDETDSFNAFFVAATLATERGGLVEALYDDSDGGRTRIGGVERAGLVLEYGTFEEQEEQAREIDRLREAIAEYLLSEPRKAGHAAAHRKLIETLQSIPRS